MDIVTWPKSSCGNCRNCRNSDNIRPCYAMVMPWLWVITLLSPCHGTTPQGSHISTRLGMIHDDPPQVDADCLRKVEDHEAEAGVCYCPGAPWCPMGQTWTYHGTKTWLPVEAQSISYPCPTGDQLCVLISHEPSSIRRVKAMLQDAGFELDWVTVFRKTWSRYDKDFSFFFLRTHPVYIYIWYVYTSVIYLRYLKIFLNIIFDTFSLGFQDL